MKSALLGPKLFIFFSTLVKLTQVIQIFIYFFILKKNNTPRGVPEQENLAKKQKVLVKPLLIRTQNRCGVVDYNSVFIYPFFFPSNFHCSLPGNTCA